MAYYARTKSALEGFSRGAARDLAHRGITVNVIQPGSSIPRETPPMAPLHRCSFRRRRLGRYFGASAQFWLNLQAHDDVDLAETV